MREWLSELVSDLRFRVRALLRRDAMERELNDEVRFHLERETEKYVSSGMTREAAARQARLAFGGVDRTKEEARDVRGVSVLDAAAQDLRYALRGLRKSPGFTAAVVLTLGLGIGANAAMFGVVDRMLFRPLPYLRDPGTVHRVYLQQVDRGRLVTERAIEYRRYLDLRQWAASVAQTAAVSDRNMAVGTGEEARDLPIAVVTASFFELFDARPVIGRFFGASEDATPSGAAVAILGYSFWRSNYGGRPDVLGSRLQVGPVLCEIIGVAPPGFSGDTDGSRDSPVAYVPVTTFAEHAGVGAHPSDYYTKYNWSWLQMLVRRRPGVGAAAASADLTSAYRRSWEAERTITQELPSMETAKPSVVAGPMELARGPQANRDTKIVLWISGVTLVVLLIACANVANLLLARALRRQRELALRVALGAGRGRLISQLLTETLVLAALGGAVGLVVAQWGGGVLRALFLDRSLPIAVVGDSRTLLFTLAVSLSVGVLTGVAPVLAAGRRDLAPALKAGAREGTYHRSRSRSLLLLVQGALSVVLLVGAGLFVRSLRNVRAIRLGYDVEPVLYVSPNARGMKFTRDEVIAFKQRLLDEAKAIPGVTSASLAVSLPLASEETQPLYVAGIDSVRRLGMFTLQAATPEYFTTMGTRIVRGRALSAEDRSGAPPVMVVSESMARALWPGRSAIGQCVRVGVDTAPCTTVVGIAEDIKAHSLTNDAGLHYYLPLHAYNPQFASLLVRVSGDGANVAEAVRRRLQRLMPGTSYVAVTPLREVVDPEVRAWQAGATMFLLYGALALLVAAVGLYSVIAYDVAQRTHELGVRIALGAQGGDVVQLVVGRGVRFAVAGVAIGGALALAGGRWLGPLLYGVSPRDPLVFGVVGATLLGVALMASWVPAVRASRVDPNVALRAE